MNIAATAGNVFLDAPRPGTSSAPASTAAIGYDPVSGIVGRYGCKSHGAQGANGAHEVAVAGTSIAGVRA